MPAGKKRAVLMTKTAVPTPQGMQARDLTKVFTLDTTLEEILGYCKEKNTNVTTVIFESEAPELPREDDKEEAH